eukprot:11467261-Karenia_brevis.AAC.1
MGFDPSVEAIPDASRKLCIASFPQGAGVTLPELTGNSQIPVRSHTGLQSFHQTYLNNWDQFSTGPEFMANDFFGAPI